jgi:hypothetical protein
MVIIVGSSFFSFPQSKCKGRKIIGGSVPAPLERVANAESVF